jgi:hypothetical protein
MRLTPKQFIDEGLRQFPDSKLVAETENYYFVNLEDMEASIYYSQNEIRFLEYCELTPHIWCTATPDKKENHFYHYKKPWVMFLFVQNKHDLYDVEVILINLKQKYGNPLQYVTVDNYHHPLTSARKEYFQVAKKLWEENMMVDWVESEDNIFESRRTKTMNRQSLNEQVFDSSKAANRISGRSFPSYEEFKKFVDENKLTNVWNIDSKTWEDWQKTGYTAWVYAKIVDYNVDDVFFVLKNDNNIVSILDTKGEPVTLESYNSIMTLMPITEAKATPPYKFQQKVYSKTESHLKDMEGKPIFIGASVAIDSFDGEEGEVKELTDDEVVVFCPAFSNTFLFLPEELLVVGNVKDLTIDKEHLKESNSMRSGHTVDKNGHPICEGDPIIYYSDSGKTFDAFVDSITPNGDVQLSIDDADGKTIKTKVVSRKKIIANYRRKDKKLEECDLRESQQLNEARTYSEIEEEAIAKYPDPDEATIRDMVNRRLERRGEFGNKEDDLMDNDYTTAMIKAWRATNAARDAYINRMQKTTKVVPFALPSDKDFDLAEVEAEALIRYPDPTEDAVLYSLEKQYIKQGFEIGNIQEEKIERDYQRLMALSKAAAEKSRKEYVEAEYEKRQLEREKAMGGRRLPFEEAKTHSQYTWDVLSKQDYIILLFWWLKCLPETLASDTFVKLHSAYLSLPPEEQKELVLDVKNKIETLDDISAYIQHLISVAPPLRKYEKELTQYLDNGKLKLQLLEHINVALEAINVRDYYHQKRKKRNLTEESQQLNEGLTPEAGLAMYAVLIPMAIYAMRDVTKDFGKWVNYSEFQSYPPSKQIEILEETLRVLKTEYTPETLGEFLDYVIETTKPNMGYLKKLAMQILAKFYGTEKAYKAMIVTLEDKLTNLRGEYPMRHQLKEALEIKSILNEQDVELAYKHTLSVIKALAKAGIQSDIEPAKIEEISEPPEQPQLSPEKWVHVSFYPTSKQQFDDVFQAEWELTELGISFDSGAGMGSIDWELDYSFEVTNLANKEEMEEKKAIVGEYQNETRNQGLDDIKPN